MPLKSHKQICSNIIKLLRVSALNGLLLPTGCCKNSYENMSEMVVAFQFNKHFLCFVLIYLKKN